MENKSPAKRGLRTDNKGAKLDGGNSLRAADLGHRGGNTPAVHLKGRPAKALGLCAMALRLHNNQNLLMWWAAPEFSLRRRGHSPLLMAFGERGKKQLWSWALPYRPRFLPPVEQPTILLSATCGDYGDAERPTAWLGM